MKNNHPILVFEAYAMYVLTGAICLVIGSNLLQLEAHYQLDGGKIAILGSAFALGRIATVYLTGYLTDKFGPQIVLLGGLVCIVIFLVGVFATTNYWVAFLAACFGGVGMGTQDTCCPLILRKAFPQSYGSSMSAGQAFFGAGSFVYPLLTGVFLSAKQPFYYTNWLFVILSVVMMALLPFGKFTANKGKDKLEQPLEKSLPPKKFQFFLLMIITFTYCAAIGSVGLYTTTYAQSIGVSENLAPMILSAYTGGKMVGCIAFIGILRKIKSSTVLAANSLVATLSIAVAMLTTHYIVLGISFFTAGLMLGVIFSIVVTLAVDAYPKSPSRGAALVAIVGGGADMLSPLLTSSLLRNNGISAVLFFILFMLITTVVGGLMLVWRERNRKISTI